MALNDQCDEFEPYRSAGWRGRVVRGWAAELGDPDPLRAYLSHPHEPVRHRPGGQTWRVRINGTDYYVKHISARYSTEAEGGWKAGKRLRWALRRSPALRLLRIDRAMRKRGIGVPRIVHVAYRGAGLSREELVVTQAVQGKRLPRIAAEDPERVVATLQLMAERVYRLHEAGIAHGHLLPGHLFITSDAADVVFIDNDENRVGRGPMPWQQRLANLAQLANQVSPIYRLWRPFFRAYFERSGLPEHRWRPMLAGVLRQARHRGEDGGRSRVERGRVIRRRMAERAARRQQVS